MAATQTVVRIRPLHDRVMRLMASRVGGIISRIPPMKSQGKVIAVYKGVEKDGWVIPLDVKKSHHPFRQIRQIKLDGEEYLICARRSSE